MPDSAAALSVLVLAWDEAAPTVRTVVEAAPAVGSLLVLLPPALPEPAPALPLKELPATETSLPAPPPAAEAALVPPTPPPTAPARTAGPPAVAGPLLPAPVAPSTPLLQAANAAPSPRTTPAVRRLHVVASQLPATIRQGSFQVPAAPYLGASAPAIGTAPPRQTLTTGASLAPSPAPAPSEAQSSPFAIATSPAAAQGSEESLASPASSRATPPTGATATLAGGTPLAAEGTPATPGPSEPLAEAAFAAAEVVDADPEDELPPAGQPLPVAATPADSPSLSDPAPTSAFSPLGPFGNRLPQLDPSPPLSVPRPVASAIAPDDPEDTPEERARLFAASVAAARQYTAPDLNSQVIRYARLAVPMALAQGAYEIIYAPAWPTWLAALELRQRTSGPLVLHLPALAAGRQPADTAAGWPAELQRQALRQADVVLVETYALARRLRRELGLGPAIVRVVPTTDVAAVARALRRARRRPGLA